MKRLYLILVLLLLGLSLMISCSSKKDQTVAQVGKDKITVGELVNEYVDMKKNASIKILSDKPELEQLRDFLERRIDSKLLKQAAYEKGLDKDPEIVNQVEQEKKNLLVRTLFEKEVLDKAKPTEKDVRDYYDKLGERIKIRHILVKTKKEAEEIYRELKKGADFDSLAKAKSLDTRTSNKGGDMGYITWNSLVGATAFKEAAFKLKPQEISHPVETLSGWHVIRLDDRKKEEQKSFEEEKDKLKTSLEMMRQQEIAIDYMVNLMKKTKMEIVASTRKMLEEKAKALSGDTLGGQPGAVNIDPAQLSEEEKALPFMKYKGGELRVDEFLTFYNRWPPFQRPPLEEDEALKEVVFNYLLAPEILRKIAKEKGLDKSEEYKDKVKFLQENLMAEKYRDEVIWKDLTVEQSDLDAFYQKNKDKFIEPAKAHVLEILVRTEKEAQKILLQLRAGADFNKLAQENTLRTSAKKRGGDLGDITKSAYPELFEAAFKLRKGELAGPIHVLQSPAGEGYSIIKLLGKEAQRQKTLEEVEPQVRGGATMEKKNAVSRRWVAEVRAKTDIKINEPALQTAFELIQKEIPPEKN